MNRTVEVLMVAMVLLILGVVVISAFQSGIDVFSEEGEDVESTGCDYQVDRAGPEGEDFVSARCADDYRQTKDIYSILEERSDYCC